MLVITKMGGRDMALEEETRQSERVRKCVRVHNWNARRSREIAGPGGLFAGRQRHDVSFLMGADNWNR